VRLRGRSRWVYGYRASPGGDHREVHRAECQRIIDVDEDPGTWRYPGGVEFTMPGIRSRAKHGEVERPFAARVGQKTSVWGCLGALGDKLAKGGHSRILTGPPED